MRVVAKAAMVVGAIAIVATGVGAVAGGAAFLSATGVSLSTVSAISAVAGLVSTAANAIAPPKAAKGTVGGQQTDFKLDPRAGIPWMVGRTYSGGNIVHRDTWGKDNIYQGFVVTYSGGGTFQSFESFNVDNAVTPLDASGNAQGTYRNWLFAKLQLPATPAGPVQTPVAGFPGLDNSFRLSGHAVNALVLQFDKKDGKKFTGGVPKNGVVGLGERVYDPRQDDTYPGGRGPCRIDDQATWVGGRASENPWLLGLSFALGYMQNGKRVLGIGMKPRGIDLPSIVEAANVADANGWKAGAVYYSTDDKWNTVMRQLSQAGGGYFNRTGAKLSAFVNAPRVALATVTEADLVGRGVVSAAMTYRDRLNGMVPQFRSEAHGWEIIDGSVVRIGSYVAVDGGEKTKEWPLPAVQQLKQAGQLTAYELVNRREFGPITLPLFIRFMGYKPGDCLNINVGPLGLVNQLAIVRKRQVDPTTGNVQLALVSETPEKHAFALGTSPTAPPIPDLSVPDESVVAPPQASDWTARGGELELYGTRVPALILTGAVRNPNAEAFMVQIRPTTSATWATVGQFPADAERVDITEVVSRESYYVGISFIRRGVVGERLQIGPATAGVQVADVANNVPGGGTIGGAIQPGGGVTGGKPVSQVLDDVDDAKTRSTAAQQSADDAKAAAAVIRVDLDKVRADVDAAEAEIDQARQELGADVASAKSEAAAARGEAATVRTDLATEVQRAKDDTASIRSVQAQIQTDVSGNRSAIETEATNRANADSALANRATSLEARGGIGGGNMAPNTQFVPRTSNFDIPGWNFVGLNERFHSAQINWPEGYYMPDENVLASFHAGPPDGGYADWYSEAISVTPGQWLQYYAYVNCHRTYAAVFLYFYNTAGSIIGNSPLAIVSDVGATGVELRSYRQIGVKASQIPDGVSQVRLVLRHGDNSPGQSDGYCWFTRPYLGYAREGQAEFNSFVHGSSRPSLYSVGARITEEATARVNADSALASRAATLEAQFRGDTDSPVLARVRAEETARANADSALANRAATLEAQFRGDTDSPVLARVRAEETARANADSALANRAETLEAQFRGEQASTIRSLIYDETTVRANADSALANRATTLEAKATYGAEQTSKAYPGFETRFQEWGFDTQAGGRNVGAVWESHHSKGAGIAFQPNQIGQWIYMDPAGWIKTTPGKRYRAGFWIWQFSAPSGYGGATRLYWEGQNRDHSAQEYLGASNNAPEATRLFYQHIPDGAWHCYATDFQVDDAFTANANSYWIRPRINIDGVPAGAGYVIAGWFFREVTGEYTNAAKILEEATARTTADSALAARATTLEAQFRGDTDSPVLARVRAEETARANADSALSNRAATLEAQFRGDTDSPVLARVRAEETARANADSALANRAATLEAQFRGDTDSPVLARVRAEETARANADSALANRATTLEARGGIGGGNLASNSQFVPRANNFDIPGWTFSPTNPRFNSAQINWPEGYYMRDENVLASFHGGPPDGGYADWYSEAISVVPGQWVQYYAYVNCHRTAGSVFLYFYNTAGSIIGNAPLATVSNTGAIGEELRNYRQVGVKATQIPDGVAHVRLMLRHEDNMAGQSDGYCWFARPYLGYAREGQTEFNSFVHGSSRSSLYAVGARVTEEATARANADSALAQRATNVEARAGNLEARTGITETAITDLKNNRASARLELQAVTPGGRAAIVLRSDNNSGAGVDIVGDTTFMGKLDVKSADSGGRMRLVNDVLRIWDDNGQEVITLGRLS